MRWLQLCLLGTVASAMVVFTAQAQQQTRQQQAGQQPARQQPAGQQAAGGQAAPRHSIKDVMENAHKAGLLKKVLDGQASQEEKMTLLDHYVSLTESAPPQGSPEGWQAKANAVVVAAAKVATGRDDGTELLKGATNCAACHKEHKPATN